MIDRKVTAIYFTGAGTTKEVVSRVCDGLGGFESSFDITPCDAVVDLRFGPDDVVVIGVPSYGGRVPAPAVEKIASCYGGGAFAVLVATYGNRDIDDTLIELSDIAEQAGFRVVAAAAFVAHHSLMVDVAVGRPDGEDCADIDTFASSVVAKMNAADDPSTLSRPAVPGSRPYREFKGVPFSPKANGGCTSCGVCARVCPTGAIPEENPSATDTSRCISCMRCVHACRLKGRSIKGMKYRIAKFVFARKFKARQGSRMYL